MSRRNKRWHPKGGGWVRTLDYGRTAAWMKKHPEGGLLVAVYDSIGFGAFYEEGIGEVWIVHCWPGSWLPRHIQDKPHRVRWALDSENNEEYVVHRFPVVDNSKRHPRNNWNRYINMWPLPRKLVAAITP